MLTFFFSAMVVSFLSALFSSLRVVGQKLGYRVKPRGKVNAMA
jgi:hypothetical protein